jgi:tetratricopeptide (TPR) repeat protein
MVSIFGVSGFTLLVTVFTFQNPQPQTANGFRIASTDKTTPEATAKSLTPEVRGDIFMARKMYREAAEMYQTGPKDSAVLANKTGIAFHQLLELESAKKWYERAVKLNSHYAEAINNLGTIYYAQKSYRRAINEYRRALVIMPESASMLSNLGTAYFARKNYTEAQTVYEKALQLDPDVFERRGTGGVLLQERSVEERAKWHYYQAKTYAKAGQTERALLCIRKSLEEGFKERDKFEKDPEFALLRPMDEFQKLMAMEQKIL